jgi:lipopolysaccharide/colanic/teichoic acid biosynthesis glycosyltransferase
LTGPQAAVKRVFDITFSLSALLVLSPVFILTAFAVRASSRGPAFYTKQRIGRRGELIPFPKFRSMRVGADKDRATILGTPDDDMLNRYRNDPRITPVGRIIRRFSIDELPQLWSVLRGDMSIVGPRPILEEELHLLDNADYRRHAAKPGLTGVWQISGRKEVPWEQRMAMDIDYLENWSIGGDLLITLKTLGAIVRGRGAV